MEDNYAVKIKDLKYSIKDKIIFNSINLDIPKGKFIAILGPNGAGKSTLLKLLLGLIKPDSGSIEILGDRVGKKSECLGYSPQTKPFDQDIPITGREYVRMGFWGVKWGFGLTNKKDCEERVNEVLGEMDSQSIADKKLGQLSGGEQQRLSLAQALVTDPELLLLDEPLANLDLSFQREIIERISRFHKDHGHTILLVAHDINPLLPYIDQVIYIANGHVKMGTIDEVINEDQLSKLYNLPVKVFKFDGRVFVATNDGVVH